MSVLGDDEISAVDLQAKPCCSQFSGLLDLFRREGIAVGFLGLVIEVPEPFLGQDTVKLDQVAAHVFLQNGLLYPAGMKVPQALLDGRTVEVQLHIVRMCAVYVPSFHPHALFHVKVPVHVFRCLDEKGFGVRDRCSAQERKHPVPMRVLYGTGAVDDRIAHGLPPFENPQAEGPFTHGKGYAGRRLGCEFFRRHQLYFITLSANGLCGQSKDLGIVIHTVGRVEILPKNS